MDIKELIGKTIKEAKEYDQGYTVGIIITFEDGTMLQVSHDRGDDFSDSEFEVTISPP